MALQRVYYNRTSKECQIKDANQSAPGGGFELIGSYNHPDSDELGYSGNHVLIHHLRDILYSVGVQSIQALKITKSTPNAPSILLNVDSLPETHAIDTVIGEFTVDNLTGPFNFTKIRDDDNKFTILPDGLLKLSAPLNYETKSSHSITVQATKAGVTPLRAIFNIQVLNVVDGLLGPTEASYREDDMEGYIVATITGLDEGSNETIASISSTSNRLSFNGNVIIKGSSDSVAGTLDLTVTTTEGRTLTIHITINEASVPESGEPVLLMSDGSIVALSGDQSSSDLGISEDQDTKLLGLPLQLSVVGTEKCFMVTQTGTRTLSIDDLIDTLEI